MVQADRLRVLLAVTGRDQQEVALAAGISPSTFSRALRGQRRLSVAARRRIVESLIDDVLAGLAV